MNKITKVEKVLEALKSGQELTAKQISHRYGVQPHNTVYVLRQAGYPIYLNDRTNSLGDTYKKYRLGTPTRSVVAAGYKAIASA
jgi:hypothetical protein